MQVIREADARCRDNQLPCTWVCQYSHAISMQYSLCHPQQGCRQWFGGVAREKHELACIRSICALATGERVICYCRRVDECVNKCGIRIRLEQWNIVRSRHLTLECIMRPIDCPYECGALVGCVVVVDCMLHVCVTILVTAVGALSTHACP